MTKLLTLLIALVITGCSITITDPEETDGEYCYLRKLYYNDVVREYPEYYNMWLQRACEGWLEPSGECVQYDASAYIEIEECTEVYYKKYE